MFARAEPVGPVADLAVGRGVLARHGAGDKGREALLARGAGGDVVVVVLVPMPSALAGAKTLDRASGLQSPTGDGGMHVDTSGRLSA